MFSMLQSTPSDDGDRRAEPAFDAKLRREFDVRTNELWALIHSPRSKNTKLAIFVHGFGGNFLNTWGKLSHLLWVGADSDKTLAEWDFLFVGYSTFDVESYLDIADRLATEWRKATEQAEPYSRRCEHIAFFGHSLGTLGIRQLLCATTKHHIDISHSIWSITLFGSPLVGCPVANLAKFFCPIARALVPYNPQLRMLRIWTEGSFVRTPWPAVKVVCGQGDWVAGGESREWTEWPGDGPIDVITLDHSDLVKPTAWKESVVIDYIRNALHARSVVHES